MCLTIWIPKKLKIVMHEVYEGLGPPLAVVTRQVPMLLDIPGSYIFLAMHTATAFILCSYN